MRAHIKTPPDGNLSPEQVSLTCSIRYTAGTTTGFPGGRTYSYFSNATLGNSYILHGAAAGQGGSV